MNKTERALTIAVEIISTTLVAYMLWRTIAGPDANKRMIMRISKSAENYAQKQAQEWAQVADKCKIIYDAHRSVTV